MPPYLRMEIAAFETPPDPLEIAAFWMPHHMEIAAHFRHRSHTYYDVITRFLPPSLLELCCSSCAARTVLRSLLEPWRACRPSQARTFGGGLGIHLIS